MGLKIHARQDSRSHAEQSLVRCACAAMFRITFTDPQIQIIALEYNLKLAPLSADNKVFARLSI